MVALGEPFLNLWTKMSLSLLPGGAMMVTTFSLFSLLPRFFVSDLLMLMATASMLFLGPVTAAVGSYGGSGTGT
jgi:hypothetical protein